MPTTIFDCARRGGHEGRKGSIMKKQFFRDLYGNTASITATGTEYKLICRNYHGNVWKRSTHISASGAKAALTRTGNGWHTTKGYVT